MEKKMFSVFWFFYLFCKQKNILPECTLILYFLLSAYVENKVVKIIFLFWFSLAKCCHWQALQTGNSPVSWRLNLLKTNAPAPTGTKLSCVFLKQNVLIFQGNQFHVSWNLAGFSCLCFSLASHLLSLVALRFVANWLPVNLVVRRYWWSRWQRKSLRCLQETGVLALLESEEYYLSLKINLQLVYVFVLHLCVQMQSIYSITFSIPSL